MNGNSLKKRDNESPIDAVDRLMHAGAAHEVSEGTGRVKARVMARLAVAATPTAQSSGRWHGLDGWIVPIAAALAMAASVWLLSQNTGPAPVSESRAVLRLTSAIDGSAAAIRGAKPERPIVVEAKRLKADVERGMGFVKSVLPRIRVNG